MKTKAFRKFFGTLAILALALGAGVVLRSAVAGTTDNMFGFAWGGNESADTNGAAVPNNGAIDGDESGLGWASFNSTDCDTNGNGTVEASEVTAHPGCPAGVIASYGVNIPVGVNGDLSGYAWSEHYGWISFNAADLAGCPSGTCKAERVGYQIKGWARILSIRDAGANAGGWSGWIQLDPPIAGTNATTLNVMASPARFEGYSYSDELGWLQFNPAQGGVFHGVTASCGSPVTDSRDGTVYDTILIGSQCWMRENMNIGTRINTGTAQTNNSTIEKYCYNDQDANCNSPHPTYADGGLYTWDEAMQYSTAEGVQGICPAGWHIPTDAEQYTLENYLKDVGQTCDASRSSASDCSTAGTKLKLSGVSGFEANLTGWWVIAGVPVFGFRDFGAPFWSSSVSGSNAWYRYLLSNTNSVFRGSFSKTNALSVRCLQGAGVVPPPNTLKICLNSCGSGSLDFNGGTVSLAPSDVRRYAVCYNTSSDCSDASGDITAFGTTSFSASNTPADAVTPTATKGEFTANAVASTQSEDVAITTASGNASMRFTTIYTPTCSSCNDEKTSHCPTEAWTSGCGANCAVGTGTRYCDMNWKEVAPGQ